MDRDIFAPRKGVGYSPRHRGDSALFVKSIHLLYYQSQALLVSQIPFLDSIDFVSQMGNNCLCHPSLVESPG